MKRTICTDAAPEAAGSCSQAAERNVILYLSGQVPIDPAPGRKADGGIKEQTFRS